MVSLFLYFFFQAEDGIRDRDVTGVQTCALPISIYGSGSGGGIKEGEWPVGPKAELLGRLRDAIDEALDFCQERNVILEAIETAQGFERIKALDDAVEDRKSTRLNSSHITISYAV